MDWSKKVLKAKDNKLNAGEEPVATAFLQPGGGVKMQVARGGIGGLLGFFVGNKMADKQAEANSATTSKQVEAYPDMPTVVCVTSQGRILVYSFNSVSGKPKDLLMEYKKGDWKVVDVKKGKLTHSMQVSFPDGGIKNFDVPRTVKLEEFSAAL